MTSRIKYFIDTEFIENGSTIDLISIGIVCDDGREYYVLNNECDHSKASDWVKKNVLECLPKMPLSNSYQEGWRSKNEIAKDILEFVGWNKDKPHFNQGKKPEFWGYYCDYDWVVFCQLFGTMMDLPTGFPMYCMDVKQLAMSKGNPRLPTQNEFEQHHALFDAQHIKTCWEFLQTIDFVV